MTPESDSLDDLPGAELVLPGLADVREGRADTIEALLVRIAAPRLRRAGLDVPEVARSEVDLEILLYRTLGARDDIADPYSRYNSLLRRLVSFERALEARMRRRA